jgi:hypothetical protein
MHINPFGVAALATSICLLLIELLVRWMDRWYREFRYCRNVQYLVWHIVLTATTITTSCVGVAKKSPPQLVASYEVALVHIATLQVSTGLLSVAISDIL